MGFGKGRRSGLKVYRGARKKPKSEADPGISMQRADVTTPRWVGDGLTPRIRPLGQLPSALRCMDPITDKEYYAYLESHRLQDLWGPTPSRSCLDPANEERPGEDERKRPPAGPAQPSSDSNPTTSNGAPSAATAAIDAAITDDRGHMPCALKKVLEH